MVLSSLLYLYAFSWLNSSKLCKYKCKTSSGVASCIVVWIHVIIMYYPKIAKIWIYTVLKLKICYLWLLLVTQQIKVLLVIKIQTPLQNLQRCRSTKWWGIMFNNVIVRCTECVFSQSCLSSQVFKSVEFVIQGPFQSICAKTKMAHFC